MPHIGNFPEKGFPRPLSIAPCSFLPLQDGMDWVRGQESIRNRSTLLDQYFFSPVSLPHNAKVTKVTLYGYRSTAYSVLQVCLYWSDRGGTENPMSILDANWSDGWGSAEDASISDPVIDNINRTYLLMLTIDPDAAVSDCKCSGVKIDWS